VPIEQEPRHRLKFENAHVRFFDVQLDPIPVALSLAPQRRRIRHIASSPTIAQDWDAERRRAASVPSARLIHRLRGQTEGAPGCESWSGYVPRYRCRDHELLRPDECGARKSESDAGRRQRTRVRHPVDPASGESTELYAPCGMLVAVSAANVVFDTPDGKEKLRQDRGEFKWRKLQQTVKLTNVGTNVFHGVDIRIK